MSATVGVGSNFKEPSQSEVSYLTNHPLLFLLANKDVFKFKIPVIAMDTPYRMRKLLEEIRLLNPEKRITLGCDLTQATEKIYLGPVAQVISKLQHEKAEFLLLIEP